MDAVTRPGAHGGGRLKTGNTTNVGRKPAEIRQAMREGVESALPFLMKVSKGHKCIDTGKVSDETGRPVMRVPTFQERLDAFDKLCKYSVGTRVDVTTDEQPVKLYVNVDDDRM